MTCSRPTHRATVACSLRNAGFSLIEMAVVLVVMGVLVGAVIRPLIADAENRVLDETQKVMAEARDGLLGYAAANGYFPCPADAASNGQEAAGTDHTTGVCPVWYGFLPAAALGLSSVDEQGYAVDGGRQAQNRIRYAITSQTIGGVTFPYTKLNGMRRVGVLSLDAEDLLFVCGSGTGVTIGVNCGTAVTLTARAVAIVWSVGSNALTGGASVDEAENPNPNGGSADRIFVSRSRSVVAATAFDDVVSWIPVNIVVNRLLASGQLP